MPKGATCLHGLKWYITAKSKATTVQVFLPGL